MAKKVTERKCFLSEHGYVHDIFISYAHGPGDGHGTAPLKSWSKQFRGLLELNLQMYGIKPVGLWLDESPDRDRSLDPLAQLDDQFAAQIRSTAMLQVHVSEPYLASKWCRRELEIWNETLPDKPGSKDRRISVIRVGDTPRNAWPKALAPGRVQLPGNRFHTWGSPVPWGFNLDWKGHAPSQEFSTEIINAAAFISRRLRELKEELDRQVAEERQVQALVAGTPASIYLHGRARRSHLWAETRDDLNGLGFEVRPASPAPDDDETEAWGKLTQIASRCQAMLLLGADQFELDNDLDVVGRDQRSLIHAKFQRYLPCAVIDRMGIGSDAFLTAARIRGSEWLDGTKQDWLDQVPGWLARSAEAATVKYGLAPGAPRGDAAGRGS